MDIETATVEIEFADGTIARWADVPAELAESLETILGPPDTIRA